MTSSQPPSERPQNGETAATPSDPLLGPLDSPDHLAEELHSRGRPTVSRVTLALGAAVLVGAAFGGGVAVERKWGDDSPSNTNRAGFPNGGQGAFPGPEGGGAGNGGTGGGNGGNGNGGLRGPGDVTFGTVESVDGDTVTLKTQDGTTVTVKTDSDTSVTVTRDGTLSDLAEGGTVVVRGSKGEDGSIDADSVSEGGGGFGPGRATR